MFYIAAGIYFFGAVFYGIFASGDLQPWAVEETGENVKSGVVNSGFATNESEQNK